MQQPTSNAVTSKHISVDVIHAGLQEMEHLVLPNPQLRLLIPADKPRLPPLGSFWLLGSLCSFMLACYLCTTALAAAAHGGQCLAI